jgi:hypothetical protein
VADDLHISSALKVRLVEHNKGVKMDKSIDELREMKKYKASVCINLKKQINLLNS